MAVAAPPDSPKMTAGPLPRLICYRFSRLAWADIRLALNHTRVAPEYFVTLMTWFGPRVAKLKTGQEDAYTFMNTGALAELPIPLPPADTQKRFVSFVRQHERLRATYSEAARQADHLFQTLLHQAFSLTVPPAARALPDKGARIRSG
jgi:hypothetical protein